MLPNVSRASPDWPPVVVAGGFNTGVVLMRSLYRRGLKVFCIDATPGRPAFRTVYGKAFLCPNPDDRPAEWLEFMTSLAGRINASAGSKPVLIASSDQFVSAFADHAEELRRHFIFCYAGTALQGLLATKKRQYEVAGTHGLPVPRTKFVENAEDIRTFAQVAQFPCLLKPLHFREWKYLAPGHPLQEQKLALANTPQELANVYGMAAEINPEVVVQEIIEGPDTNKLVYLSCYSQKSERIAWCMVRQLRTDPVHFGSASVVEPVDDPSTSRLCDEFLKSLGYAGICEIELKLDDRDGQVRMIEANPRYSVTADAAQYAGVDIGWLHYLDLIGQHVTPVEPGARDFRHISLFREVSAIRSARALGLLSWRDVLRTYRRPLAFFDFDWRDWRVSLGTVLQLARQIAGPSIRRIFPRRHVVNQ